MISSGTALGRCRRDRRARPRAAGRSRSRRRRPARSRRAGAARARDRARRRTARPSPPHPLEVGEEVSLLSHCADATRPFAGVQAARAPEYLRRDAHPARARRRRRGARRARVRARGRGDAVGAATGRTGGPLPTSYEASALGRRVRAPDVGRAVRVAGRHDPSSASTTPSPPEGSSAALRLNAPGAGTTLEGVWLGRSVTGPGLLRPHVERRSWRRSTAAGTLDGVFDARRRPARGWSSACAARRAGCDMTGAALDFSSIALLVRDDLRAHASPSTRLPPYAAGVFGVIVDARDDGHRARAA